MIVIADVPLGRAGLPSCMRCGSPPRSVLRPRSEVLVDLDSVVSGWRDGPGPNVCFSGTEAFRYEALPEVIDLAAGHGVERIGVESAGAGLAENAGAALESGVRLVELVVLAADERTQRVLSGARAGASGGVSALGAFASAARLRRIQVMITARIPVCRHNLDTLPATVTALAGAGAACVRLDVGDSAFGRESEWLDAVGGAIEAGTVRGAWTYVDAAEPLLGLGGMATVPPIARVRAS